MTEPEEPAENVERLVQKLAALCGILPEYYDIWGNRHETPVGTKRAILASMGHNVGDAEALREEIREKLAPRLVEPVTVLEADAPQQIALRLPCADRASFRLEITDEEGALREFSQEKEPSSVAEINGSGYGEYVFALGEPLSMGYYDLSAQARCGDLEASGYSKIIAAPPFCHLPPDIGKTWGIVLGMYSLRSRKNWGIGDLRDLGEVVDWVSSMGGDFVGVLPMHAIALPGGPSPYSPVSRVYKNFIYLDLEAVPEFEAVRDVPRRRLAGLRKKKLVDYEGVFEVKDTVLREMFRHFYEEHYLKSTPRAEEFKCFMEREGQSLLDYATFMALSDIYRRGWMDWPEEYQNPQSAAVKTFRKSNYGEVLFHAYGQWLLDGQLAGVAARAKKAGMRLGLYFDLAVGSLGGGADAWGFRQDFAIGVDAGAPPDDFNPNGQNWGFPPLIPERLRETGHELFIKTIRKNLEHGGLLRIDHALGLFRLFWIPAGMKPSEGAYVACPAEEQLAILALESARLGAVIVAEDLGTVPAEAREALARKRMLSYRLFYFERKYPAPDFLPPQDYPETALCAVTTHDLPTISGFWAGRDIEVRKRLSLYLSEEAYNTDVAARGRDRTLIVEALVREGLLPEGYEAPPRMNEELVLAVYRFLARTPSLLVAVSLDDWLGSLDQQNMPGTVDEHPNWRQKTPLMVEGFSKGGAGLKNLFAGEGRGRVL
jgi:4-alpha-glucanotransferase